VKILLVLLIVTNALAFSFLDSAVINKGMSDLKQLQERTNEISDKMERGAGVIGKVGSYFSAQEKTAAREEIKPQPGVLTPPDQLFKRQEIIAPQPRVNVRYNNSSKYVKKTDFNKIVDSLTQQFKTAIAVQQNQINELVGIGTDIAKQSNSHANHINTIINFITGGGLVALLAAITALVGVFRKRPSELRSK